MAERAIERALYLAAAAALKLPARSYGRLYFGNEFCSGRLPGRRELVEVRRKADAAGMTFSLVTPQLNEEDLPTVKGLIDVIDPAAGDEVVANDVGLLELLRGGGWEGEIVVGRLLTKQRRGAAWKGGMPAAEGDRRYLQGSSLDSPGWVEWFRERYGVRRFEIDNLIQGVRVGRIPEGVSLSVYHPYLLLTITRHCPWSFDGRRWTGGAGCPEPCREERLVLLSEAGGRAIRMGGAEQFLENDSKDIYSEPPVDRIVIQPEIPV